MIELGRTKHDNRTEHAERKFMTQSGWRLKKTKSNSRAQFGWKLAKKRAMQFGRNLGGGKIRQNFLAHIFVKISGETILHIV